MTRHNEHEHGHSTGERSTTQHGLAEGYGVLIGTFIRFYSDQQVKVGRYHHGNITIQAGSHQYRAAIDIDSNGLANGHLWSFIDVSPDDFASVLQLDDGWHQLASNSTSGALDYIRSPQFPRPIAWQSGDDKSSLAALQSFVTDSTIKKFYVYGEPFGTGYGVHNAHQNQGSAVGGGHDHENGIWQDGAVFVEKQDGSVVAYLNKFSNEASETDDQGNPVTGGGNGDDEQEEDGN